MDRAILRARNPLLLLALLTTGLSAPRTTDTDTERWQRQAARVTITRDDWGIPHVRGRSDGDAVFGLMYAQGEDDFSRVEANYLTALGRTAEAEGEDAIWGDLRQRLFVDPDGTQSAVCGKPRVSTNADASLGGRAELLSRDASRNQAQSPDAV